jgi:hypothetical protein
MGSTFMPRSISLYRGIARFSSTHLDGGILHNANDRSKITRWFFYNFASPPPRMQQAIEQKLKPIKGLSVWAAGRAASLLWLQIGDRHVVATRNGGRKTVGTFALHIDCPWSWTQNGNVIANQDSDLDQLNELLSTAVVCERISASDNGSFELSFNNDSTLVVSVEVDPDPSADEYWRFFEPVTDTPHFVVGSRGIEA